MEEVGRQHQGMDRPGVCQVPEGSGEQRKMEETGREIIGGAQRPSQLRNRWDKRWVHFSSNVSKQELWLHFNYSLSQKLKLNHFWLSLHWVNPTSPLLYNVWVGEASNCGFLVIWQSWLDIEWGGISLYFLDLWLLILYGSMLEHVLMLGTPVILIQLYCPKQLIHKLQKVQNNAARLICRTPKFDHISPVLHTLHWLPVEQRTEYKLLLLAFNLWTANVFKSGQ